MFPSAGLTWLDNHLFSKMMFLYTHDINIHCVKRWNCPTRSDSNDWNINATSINQGSYTTESGQFDPVFVAVSIFAKEIMFPEVPLSISMYPIKPH